MAGDQNRFPEGDKHRIHHTSSLHIDATAATAVSLKRLLYAEYKSIDIYGVFAVVLAAGTNAAATTEFLSIGTIALPNKFATLLLPASPAQYSSHRFLPILSEIPVGDELYLKHIQLANAPVNIQVTVMWGIGTQITTA